MSEVIKDDFYTLYKKTHLITGMQYLGYTELADVIEYKGSGKEWSKHLKEFGRMLELKFY